MTPRRDQLPGEPGRPALAPQRPGRKPGGAGSVLAVQRMAGNRATTQLLARKKVKPKEPPPLDAQADLAFALKYVDDYYERVRDMINLKNEVQQQALENFKEFGKLKDPPSIADAVFAEIFNQVVGLIPGGKLVTAAVSAGVFTVQLAQLQKELDDYPIPGMSVEDERKKGPSEKTKAKVEKGVGHGKTGLDAGKAIVGAGIKAYEERAAASAAEAAAKENAAMQGKRITDWRKAIELAQAQEAAITDTLELAARKGTDRGKLKEAVVKQLGPLPRLSEQQQDELERKYELELYRQKLTIATVTTKYHGGYRMPDSSETELELVGGGTPSAATLRRVADLLGHSWLVMYPLTLANRLGVGHSARQRYERVPGLEPSRPGMGG